MEELFIGFLIGIVTMALAVRVVAWAAERKLQGMIQNLQDQIEASRIYLKIEKHSDGSLIAYNKHTDEFIAQGKTFEDLAEAFKSRFPDKTGVVDKDDLIKWQNT